MNDLAGFEAARRCAEEHYSYSAVGKRLSHLYDDAV